MSLLMAKKSSRKLFLFGRYSLALLLPKKWLSELGAKRGDLVNLELDRARQRIVIRFGANSTKSTAGPRLRPVEAEHNDLQPIPEL